MRHVVMFSGGVGSFSAAERVMREHGRGITLLFADTLIEDADLYRFLIEASAFLTGHAGRTEVSGLAARAAVTPPSSDIEARRAHLAALREDARQVIPNLVWLCDGRTPWQVFRDVRYLGNARIAACSRVLKQDMNDAWLAAHCDPADTIVYVGIDWTEEHRLTRLRARRAVEGWDYRAPLCDPPYITKDDCLARLASIGIATPRLYRMGFSHNNCGGGCVRAGMGHFANLLRNLPDVYAEWERGEAEIREFLGRDDVTIVREWPADGPRNITLTQLRKKIEAGHQPDLFDIGGCGCFVDTEAES